MGVVLVESLPPAVPSHNPNCGIYGKAAETKLMVWLMGRPIGPVEQNWEPSNQSHIYGQMTDPYCFTMGEAFLSFAETQSHGRFSGPLALRLSSSSFMLSST